MGKRKFKNIKGLYHLPAKLYSILVRVLFCQQLTQNLHFFVKECASLLHIFIKETNAVTAPSHNAIGDEFSEHHQH